MSSDPNELFFELKLVDATGRVHGVVRRPIDRNAAFMGQRIKEDLEFGIVAVDKGMSPFNAAVKILRVKELRRDLLKQAGSMAGGQLADFLQDREGWHGLDRQDSAEKSVKDF